MAQHLDKIVELEGCRGDWFDLTNGTEGIYLATKVDGFYDPPVKVFYEEPGTLPGSRHLGDRILRRDLSFGVEILNDHGDGKWMTRDSLWRKNWSFSKVSKLYITSEESGTRWLNCRLGESPEVDMRVDPQLNSINRTNMIVYAGDPFWWEEDKVFTVKTKKDTQFEPTLFDIPGVWPWEELPQEELSITVDASVGGLNPTDQYIYPIWTTPRIQDTDQQLPLAVPSWHSHPVGEGTLHTVRHPRLQFRGRMRSHRTEPPTGGSRPLA